MVFIGEGTEATERGMLRISQAHADPNQQDPNPSIRVEQVEYWDTTAGAVDVVGVPDPTTPGTSWQELAQNGVLTTGTRIRLINGSNEIWLAVDARSFIPDATNFTGNPPTPVNSNVLYLARPHPDYLGGTRDGYRTDTTPPGPPGTPQQYTGDAEHDIEYELALAGSVVLANQEPAVLSSGIVIDPEPLRIRGKLPAEWYSTTAQQYGYIDVMFSPRGTVMRSSAARGVLHFLVAELEDVERRGPPGSAGSYIVVDPANAAGPPALEVDGFIARDVDGNNQIDEGEQVTGDKVLVTVFTRTGHISTHPIDPTDAVLNVNGNAGADGFADDPLSFAERGDVAQ
jgi:hypothetical protein